VERSLALDIAIEPGLCNRHGRATQKKDSQRELRCVLVR
jgi:hypothetical protein